MRSSVASRHCRRRPTRRSSCRRGSSHRPRAQGPPRGREHLGFAAADRRRIEQMLPAVQRRTGAASGPRVAVSVRARGSPSPCRWPSRLTTRNQPEPANGRSPGKGGCPVTTSGPRIPRRAGLRQGGRIACQTAPSATETAFSVVAAGRARRHPGPAASSYHAVRPRARHREPCPACRLPAWEIDLELYALPGFRSEEVLPMVLVVCRTCRNSRLFHRPGGRAGMARRRCGT